MVIVWMVSVEAAPTEPSCSVVLALRLTAETSGMTSLPVVISVPPVMLVAPV